MAQINIRVTDEQKALINKLAKENNKTISAYIIDKVCIESVYQDDSKRIEEDNKYKPFFIKFVILMIIFLLSIILLNKNKTPINPEVIYVEGKEDNILIEVAMQYNDA